VPIEHPQSDEQIWINEVMDNAGWSGANAFEKCFAYNNSIRDDNNTNWCFSIFIVDSNPAVNQGLFLGGGYAWAYYGGPWIYMSRFSSWAYNASRYWAVVPMHETGHIFMATDEYDGYQQWQGYLDENDNPSTAVVCIENQNDSTRVCPETRRQLGWRDLDTDDIVDILDAEPVVTLNPSLPDPTSDPTPVWTGSAGVTTIPNLNPASYYYPPHDMTIARISTVECRVDAGAWSPAVANDGAFDGYLEDWADANWISRDGQPYHYGDNYVTEINMKIPDTIKPTDPMDCLGFTWEQISADYRKKYLLEGYQDNQVVVTSVKPGSAAAQAGLRAGICIMPVPALIFLVCASTQVIGVTASDP
jgi:hypothetical protein